MNDVLPRPNDVGGNSSDITREYSSLPLKDSPLKQAAANLLKHSSAFFVGTPANTSNEINSNGYTLSHLEITDNSSLESRLSSSGAKVEKTIPESKSVASDTDRQAHTFFFPAYSSPMVKPDSGDSPHRVESPLHTQLFRASTFELLSDPKPNAIARGSDTTHIGIHSPQAHLFPVNNKIQEILGNRFKPLASSSNIQENIRDNHKDHPLAQTLVEIPFIFTQAKQDAILKETRLKYIVRSGDTLESIASKILYDSSLAPLIYEINKLKIPVKIKGGKKLLQLKEQSILFLPTINEIKLFKRKFFGKSFQKFEYDIESIIALDSSLSIIDKKKSNQIPDNTKTNQPNPTCKKTRQIINKEKHTYKHPDDCYIISYINTDKSTCLIYLKYQREQKWLPVIVYKIEENISNRYEYNLLGLCKKIKIDLPPKQVKQLANNDLTTNWKDYLQKYDSL